VHIVGLPDPAAARAFAFDEPGYQAGVYRDVLLCRWRNLLGDGLPRWCIGDILNRPFVFFVAIMIIHMTMIRDRHRILGETGGK
jgi:hypothetical protein